MREFSFRERFRYRFDDWMSRGPIAQMAMLGALSSALVVAVGVVLWAFSLAPVDPGSPPESFAQSLWRALTRSMDSGTVGGDSGPWSFLLVELVVTFGGIFVLSALIGVLNGAIEGLLERLRKGRSLVVERNHTVILGWTPKVHLLLSELAEANSNVPGASVVVLADRDKVEMDDEIRERLTRRLRVVTRSGSPMSPEDLDLVNLADAKSVIVLSPENVEDHEADTVVLKSLLAISKSPSWAAGRVHVVAELKLAKMLDVARLVVGDRASLILSPPLISRLLVQTGRQSGLSAVVVELLDFAGNEIYMRPVAGLAGKTFAQGLAAFDDSALIGVLTPDDRVLVPPPFDRPFVDGDRAICISADDDTVIANGRGAADDAAIPKDAPVSHASVERTLVLGAAARLPLVLAELDPYVAPGSETIVVGIPEAVELGGPFSNMKVRYHAGDPTDRPTLAGLDIPTFDHVLVLSESDVADPDVADARTMVTLLILRDILRKSGAKVPITTEMNDLRNQELASVAEADDFIVSDTLISLMLSQISENAHLVPVFEELFSPGGYEIYLKPAVEFVKLGVEVDFYTVTEAAARRKQVAIGYRLQSHAREAGFGVVIDPKKSGRLTFSADDKVIVLSED